MCVGSGLKKRFYETARPPLKLNSQKHQPFLNGAFDKRRYPKLPKITSEHLLVLFLAGRAVKRGHDHNREHLT